MILLDTHVVVWLAASSDRLSRPAHRAIEQARGAGLAISAVTLFELAHLASRKRILISVSLDSFLAEIESRFVVIPLDAPIAAGSVQLPASYPKDPVDRIIGATALVHDLELVTADEGIRNSAAVKTIW